jgi:hypothetical protein
VGILSTVGEANQLYKPVLPVNNVHVTNQQRLNSELNEGTDKIQPQHPILKSNEWPTLPLIPKMNIKKE